MHLHGVSIKGDWLVCAAGVVKLPLQTSEIADFHLDPNPVVTCYNTQFDNCALLPVKPTIWAQSYVTACPYSFRKASEHSSKQDV